MTLPPDVVTRPCACGVAITASRTAPFAVVSRHVRTPQHREWWTGVQADWQGQS